MNERGAHQRSGRGSRSPCVARDALSVKGAKEKAKHRRGQGRGQVRRVVDCAQTAHTPTNNRLATKIPGTWYPGSSQGRKRVQASDFGSLIVSG